MRFKTSSKVPNVNFFLNFFEKRVKIGFFATKPFSVVFRN
jgi:hypothetical protein